MSPQVYTPKERQEKVCTGPRACVPGASQMPSAPVLRRSRRGDNVKART